MPHYLQEPLENVIDQLDLSEREKNFIKGRWLDQLIYADKRASRDQKKYFRYRVITIVGGVVVPALVSLNNIENPRLRNAISWVTFVTSLTVAVSAAVEEFFQYGESYRRFRNTAEGMKIEGWSYFQLSGPYENATSHKTAYKTFAAHVENIIKKDVEGYNAEMMKKQEQEKEEQEGESTGAKTVQKSVQTVETTQTTIQPTEPSAPAKVKVETKETTVETKVEQVPETEPEAPAAEQATPPKEEDKPAKPAAEKSEAKEPKKAEKPQPKTEEKSDDSDKA